MSIKSKLLKLRLAAIGDIKPTKFVGIEGEGRRVTKMNPKDFLDRASSTGLEESLAGRMDKLMNNSGVLSDLGGVHTGDPENPLVKSRDFSSYGTEKAGINSVNKILGTGKDTRDENLKKHMERREIFRGDELGTIEFLKRKLRRGDPIERPQFDLNERGKVVGHEGRHRSRALLEEGIDEEEVTLFNSDKFTADHPEFIVGQRNSLDELKRNVNFSEKNKIDLGRDVSFWDAEKDKSVNKRVSTKTLRDKLDTIKTDTRAPIFGRYSKQRVAIKTRHNVVMNPEHGRMIADAYDNLQHTPNDTRTQEAYKAFNQETLQQFNDLRSKGLQVRKLKSGEPGYATAEDMHKDIMENNSLSYFPTEEGFGTDEKPAEHPMLQGSGVVDADGKEIPFNDIFRIVHDVNGHNLGDMSDFSAEGEQAAFLTHRQQYSPIAQRALFTETAGQANWGAFNKVSGLDNLRKIAAGKHDEIVFAEQKAGLFPDEIIFGKWHGE